MQFLFLYSIMVRLGAIISCVESHKQKDLPPLLFDLIAPFMIMVHGSSFAIIILHDVFL